MSRLNDNDNPSSQTIVNVDYAKNENEGLLYDVIDMGVSLTITEVTDMVRNINTQIVSKMKITIDASKIQRIDGAGLQLLCAISREANNSNLELMWQGGLTSIKEAAVQLGVFGCLNG